MSLCWIEVNNSQLEGAPPWIFVGSLPQCPTKSGQRREEEKTNERERHSPGYQSALQSILPTKGPIKVLAAVPVDKVLERIQIDSLAPD